jgi:HEAT repeat protein
MNKITGNLYLLTVTCCLCAAGSGLFGDAIYLKNGRTMEGKIISENEKSVTIEIGYGTITINRAYIKEVIAEEWTPPKPPKKALPEETVAQSREPKPISATPAGNLQALLDSYAQNPKQKEINSILARIITMPEDGESGQLFDELINKSAGEKEYFLLLLKEIQDPNILKWTILALGRHQVPAAVKPLFEILNGANEILKLAVLNALRYMKDISTIHLLRAQLSKEKSPAIKTAIINSLFIAEDKESLPILVDYLDDPDNEVRKATTNSIVTIARKSTADELHASDLIGRLKVKAISTKQKETREEIINIFGQLKNSDALSTLMDFLTDENAEIRSEAAMALGNIGDKQATGFLIERLQKEEDEWTKMQLIGALQKTNDPAAIPEIIEMLRDDRERVRLSAARALRNITPKAFAEDYNKWKEWWEAEQKK